MYGSPVSMSAWKSGYEQGLKEGRRRGIAAGLRHFAPLYVMAIGIGGVIGAMVGSVFL